MRLDIAGPWGWIVAGIALLALEVVAPGAFMMWLGIAAIVTGVIAFAVPLSWEWAGLLFAGLALASVGIGKRFNGRAGRDGDAPFLNNRGQALVGRIFVLDSPIENGVGRVRVDDTVWRVQGDDAPSGAQVLVAGVDGSTLKVVPKDPG